MSKHQLDTACPFTKEERASRAMRRAMLVEVPPNPCRGNMAGELEFCKAVCGHMNWERFWREIMGVAASDLAKEVDRLMLEEMKRG